MGLLRPADVPPEGWDERRRATGPRRPPGRREGARAPVRVGQHVRLETELFVSGRGLTARRYEYDVYRTEAHPDFAEAPHVAAPHVWLAPHRALAGDYEPLSASCRWVVAALVRDGYLPGRSQYTAVLVLYRDYHGKRQVLLRREPGWGYALPTKRRRDGESYPAAAGRVARDELGIDPAALGLKPTRETVVTARDLSRSEHTYTFYCHGVFEAAVPDGTGFATAGALVWADAKTVLAGDVRDHQTPDGQKAPDDRVSPTAQHILQELGLIPLIDPVLVRP